MVSWGGKMNMAEVDLAEISGIGTWTLEERKRDDGQIEERIYRVKRGDEVGKAFLVMRPKTLEVRSERNLGKRLRDEYETVMESRYFGRGGVEIVPSGQLSKEEIDDLIRLSYNLTMEMRE